LSGASFASTPTRPGYPLVEHGGEDDWTKLSHIIFNISAMLWRKGGFPLSMFKAMLRSYNNIGSADEMDRMIDGIISIESENSQFRFVHGGAVFFEWGWRITITLDEEAYAGIGYYIFTVVLKEILMSFTPVNTLLEIHARTRQSGLIAEWRTLE
jgi:type VI secretion system protein ImpG